MDLIHLGLSGTLIRYLCSYYFPVSGHMNSYIRPRCRLKLPVVLSNKPQPSHASLTVVASGKLNQSGGCVPMFAT